MAQTSIRHRPVSPPQAYVSAIPAKCDVINFMLGYLGWPEVTDQVVEDLAVLSGVEIELIETMVRYGHVSPVAKLTDEYQRKLDEVQARRRAKAALAAKINAVFEYLDHPELTAEVERKIAEMAGVSVDAVRSALEALVKAETA